VPNPGLQAQAWAGFVALWKNLAVKNQVPSCGSGHL